MIPVRILSNRLITKGQQHFRVLCQKMRFVCLPRYHWTKLIRKFHLHKLFKVLFAPFSIEISLLNMWHSVLIRATKKMARTTDFPDRILLPCKSNSM